MKKIISTIILIALIVTQLAWAEPVLDEYLLRQQQENVTIHESIARALGAEANGAGVDQTKLWNRFAEEFQVKVKPLMGDFKAVLDSNDFGKAEEIASKITYEFTDHIRANVETVDISEKEVIYALVNRIQDKIGNPLTAARNSISPEAYKYTPAEELSAIMHSQYLEAVEEIDKLGSISHFAARPHIEGSVETSMLLEDVIFSVSGAVGETGKITFSNMNEEELFNAVRREKTDVELQQRSEDFFRKIIKYSFEAGGADKLFGTDMGRAFVICMVEDLAGNYSVDKKKELLGIDFAGAEKLDKLLAEFIGTESSIEWLEISKKQLEKMEVLPGANPKLEQLRQNILVSHEAQLAKLRENIQPGLVPQLIERGRTGQLRKNTGVVLVERFTEVLRELIPLLEEAYIANRQFIAQDDTGAREYKLCEKQIVSVGAYLITMLRYMDRNSLQLEAETVSEPSGTVGAAVEFVTDSTAAGGKNQRTYLTEV